MSTESFAYSIGEKRIDLQQSMQTILLGGFAIEGYWDMVAGSDTRVANVVEGIGFSYQKRFVGRGEAHTAEASLVRAVFTFEEARRLKLYPAEIPEYRDGEIVPALDTESQLDRMIRDGVKFQLTVHEDLKSFKARLKVKTIEDPIESTSDNPIDALEFVTHRYHFRNKSDPKTMRLPVTLFRD